MSHIVSFIFPLGVGVVKIFLVTKLSGSSDYVKVTGFNLFSNQKVNTAE